MKVLQQIDADIIALQEVVRAEGNREHDQAEYIASELGFDFCLGENRKIAGGAYGNLLLSRFPLKQIRNHDISVDGYERRGCLRVDIDLGDTTLHVFNVHLGTSFLERRQQARKLVSPEILQNAELSGVRVLLGDLNEWTSGLASRLLHQHFQRAGSRTHMPSRTYPGVFPLLYLDRIYLDAAINVERLMVHRSRTALIASDHLPVIADCEIAGPCLTADESKCTATSIAGS